MQMITRYFGHSILTAIVFVLVNILWVLSTADLVGPQIGGEIYVSVINDTPHLVLERLECPFLVEHSGQTTVVATVKNPYDEVHQYIVYFRTATYKSGSFPTCTQPISIPPQQTREASCIVNHPEVETDSFMVIVDAYLERDPAEEMNTPETLASSYEGLCIIQSGQLPPSAAQTRVLLGCVGALVVLGWTFFTWKYLGTASRAIVLIAGPLAWALVSLMGAAIGAYLPLLFLFVMVISIALILWIINRRLEKHTAGTIE
jgi:hypothetical protein